MKLISQPHRLEVKEESVIIPFPGLGTRCVTVPLTESGNTRRQGAVRDEEGKVIVVTGAP